MIRSGLRERDDVADRHHLQRRPVFRQDHSAVPARAIECSVAGDDRAREQIARDGQVEVRDPGDLDVARQILRRQASTDGAVLIEVGAGARL